MNNTRFEDLKKEIDNKRKNDAIDASIYKEAMNLFDKAKFERDKAISYKYAMDAYEMLPSNYEILVYASSLVNDKFKRLEILIDLYNEVIGIINSYDKDSLVCIYDKTELLSRRFNDLKYHLGLSLIECEKYNDGIKYLLDVDKDIYKTKHLIMNAYIKCNNYSDAIKLYDEASDEEIRILLPLALAYLKSKNYTNALKYIERIKRLNKYVVDIIMAISNNDNELINKINNQSSRVFYNTKEEVYFALKYFCDLYIDLEFVKIFNS